MSSNINPNNINGNFPVAGQDNDSQGFRDNFTNILNNFSFAATEITDLQNSVTNIASTVDTNGNVTAYYANVQQGLEVGSTSSFNDDVTFAGNLTFTYAGGGNPAIILPTDDNSYDIGSSTNTFRNIYTNELTANTTSVSNAIMGGTVYEINVVSGAPTATQDINLSTSSTWYFTSNATTNCTLNFKGSSTVTGADYLGIGGMALTRIMITNGAVAYRPTTFQVDGVTQTVKWLNGSAPGSGTVNAIDVYLATIIRTGVSSYSVTLARQVYY